ncbi:MAG: glutamine synthetase family protein, partial [Bryobacteraceae bacterium]
MGGAGLAFCDVIFGWDIGDALYDNAALTGWHTGYPDAVARPDPATYRPIPWERETALFLLDLFDKEGRPMAVAPRQLLQRIVARAEAMGYRPMFAVEYEFWFFRENAHTLREKGFRNLTTLSPGMFGYSVLRASANAELVVTLFDQLAEFGIPLEGLHTETGPGVYEAAINADTAVAAADKAALFKTAVKEIAARYDLVPTFMAKWSVDLPGSGGHLHQSLWDRDGKRNLFHRAGAMSPLMKQYIAGLVALAPEWMALLAPTINSYKRTVPGTWAPINSTWGVDNRTTAVRAIPGSAKSTRVEMRLTGADINPYLAIAASLAAGLEGIQRKLKLPPAVTNAYESKSAPPLPRNLAEATRRFRASRAARRWFGGEFVDHYAATREWEVRQFEKAVTDWELQRYLESI